MFNKTAKQPVNYQMSLVASAFTQEMSSKTALKQDKFTGSEGDLTEKVEQTSREDLTPKNVTSEVCKVKHAKKSQGSTETTRYET